MRAMLQFLAFASSTMCAAFLAGVLLTSSARAARTTRT